jgi:hypothetical protein
MAARLVVYFIFILSLFAILVFFVPWGSDVLPVGGNEIDVPGSAEAIFDAIENPQENQNETENETVTWGERLKPALALLISLACTISLMIPITWVYMATRFAQGYRRTFVAALIMLPICATSIVLLIQDSLALAFGLAALVAAVRFRVDLTDALDGIHIFAAICVGLASGVGYLGVGFVMTIFFCFASVILWHLNYGANPVEEARQARKLEALAQKHGSTIAR